MTYLSGVLCLLFFQHAFALKNGTDIPETQFPAVKKIQFGANGVCTGTFIGPHTMLTAAHCVVQAGGSVPNGTAKDFNLKVDGVAAIAYRISPKYFSVKLPEQRFEYDVAIVEFPANKVMAATPASVVPLSKCAKIGDRVGFVGYGYTDDNYPGTAGTKRYGTNAIQQKMFGQLHATWYPDVDIDKTRAITLKGDSGGPWMNDGGEIIGVTNAGSGVKMNQQKYPTYQGAAVDMCEPATRTFLQQAVKEVGGSATSLFTGPSSYTPGSDDVAPIVVPQ